jgi:heat shock protein HtpX
VTDRSAIPGSRGAALGNLAKTSLLAGVIAAFCAGLGWLLADTRGAALFAVCALLAGIGAVWIGDRALLGMLRARPLAEAEAPGLRSTVDRIAAQLAVPRPKISLIDDGFPRAFAVGRGARSATVVVSRGILGALPGPELDAVLAHELAHVRSRDVLTQTSVVLFATTLVETSRIGGWFSRALLYVFAPIAAAFTHLLLSQRRETAADRVAAAATDPDALADALLRLDRAGELVHFEGAPTTEPLYTVNPFDTDDRLSRMFVTHPALDTRVRRLRALRDVPREPSPTSES